MSINENDAQSHFNQTYLKVSPSPCTLNLEVTSLDLFLNINILRMARSKRLLLAGLYCTLEK